MLSDTGSGRSRQLEFDAVESARGAYDLSLFGLFRRPRPASDCREVIDRASDYVDGDAPPKLAERIRLHLDACKDCRGLIGTLRATISALRGLPHEHPPQHAIDRARRISGE